MWISELSHKLQKIRNSLCWNNTCQDNRHLQQHLELILGSLQKCKPLGQTTRKRNLFDLQIENCAPGTRTRIADIDNRFCREIGKSFSAGKVYPNICIWTIHVPNENNSAIVIPTIRGECITHLNCSQLFHTCLQRNIGSCRGGEFHHG